MLRKQRRAAQQYDGRTGERQRQPVGQPVDAAVDGGKEYGDGGQQQPDGKLGPGPGGRGEAAQPRVVATGARTAGA